MGHGKDSPMPYAQSRRTRASPTCNKYYDNPIKIVYNACDCDRFINNLAQQSKIINATDECELVRPKPSPMTWSND